MAQIRIDGSEEPASRTQRIRDLLIENADADGQLDYEAVVEECVRRGIFDLGEIIAAARQNWRREVEREARRLKDKNGAPAIIPVLGKPHQGVLLNQARTEDRYRNVLVRGLQTFGHWFSWNASAADMRERGEDALPVAEFKDGWRQILQEYQLVDVGEGSDMPETDG